MPSSALDDKLRARHDLEDEDVPEIIARAQALQDEAREAEARLSAEDVKVVSRE